MIANEYLEEVIRMLGIGFAIGVGGGAFAFIIGTITNSFFSIADE